MTSNRAMAGIQITTAHSQSENMNVYVLKCRRVTTSEMSASHVSGMCR